MNEFGEFPDLDSFDFRNCFRRRALSPASTPSYRATKPLDSPTIHVETSKSIFVDLTCCDEEPTMGLPLSVKSEGSSCKSRSSIDSFLKSKVDSLCEINQANSNISICFLSFAWRFKTIFD